MVQLIGILTVLVTVELFSEVQETRKHNFKSFNIKIKIIFIIAQVIIEMHAL